MTVTGAYGRQVSNSPVGSTSTTNNPRVTLPYNYGQAYAPKTYVGIVDETHVFTPHLVNQIHEIGFGRYASPGTNVNYNPLYSATKYGYTGAPAGQAAEAFPNVTFSGANAPTNFGGYVGNIGIANSYELLDNAQWTLGKRSLTIGGMISWLRTTTPSILGDPHR